MDHFYYLCIVFFMPLSLPIAVLRSPDGKGLTSWLLFVMFNCVCHFPMWYSGSGVVSSPNLCHLSCYEEEHVAQ